jgi:hypothetical protein
MADEQLAAARVNAAHVDADLYAYIRWATSGRSTEPTVALRHASLSCDRSKAAQAGNGALAFALAERVADLQAAYDAGQAEQDRQNAERRARIIAERAAAADPREVVIIPCGSRKLDHPAPAGEMYVGSYHRACARAAAARGGRVLIMSARYGLLDPSTVIEPYNLRMGQPGSVTRKQLREQAGRLGVLGATRVTVIAGRRYAAKAREVWAHVEQPLCGTRGIGEQLARLAGIAATPRPERGRQVQPATRAEIPGQLALFDTAGCTMQQEVC